MARLIAELVALIMSLLAATTPAPVTAPVVVEPAKPVAAPVVARAPLVPSLPAGITLEYNTSGCTSFGFCHPPPVPTYAYIHFPTLTVVIINNYDGLRDEHELCHAHQYLTVQTMLRSHGNDMPGYMHVDAWLEDTTQGRTWAASGGTFESFAEQCAYAWRTPDRLPANTYELLQQILY